MASGIGRSSPDSEEEMESFRQLQMAGYYREHEEVFNNIRSTLERIDKRRMARRQVLAKAANKARRTTPDTPSDLASSPDFGNDEDDEEEDEDYSGQTGEKESSKTRAKGKKDFADKIKRRGSRLVTVVSQGQQKLQTKLSAGLAAQQHRRAALSEKWGSVRDSIKTHGAAMVSRRGGEPGGRRRTDGEDADGDADESEATGEKRKRRKRFSTGGELLGMIKHRRFSLDSKTKAKIAKSRKLRKTNSNPDEFPPPPDEPQPISLFDLVEHRPVGKVPLRVRLVEDVITSDSDSAELLSAGDVLTVLKIEEDALVRFQGKEVMGVDDEPNESFRARPVTFEESAAQFRDLCSFRLLPSSPQHEGQRFTTVNDVITAKPSPPERVRILGRYNGDGPDKDNRVELGDTLIVGTATCERDGQEYAVWFRQVLHSDDSSLPDGDVIGKREPVLLPLDADCGFSADFPDELHSLQRLADDIQSGVLSLPCRVSVAQTKPSGRPTQKSSTVPHSLIGRRHLITRVTPTQNLLVASGQELIRLPSVLTARLHCVQVAMDTSAMLGALRVLVLNAEQDTNIRTLRQTQPNSFSAQILGQMPRPKPSTVERKLQQRQKCDEPPSPPRTPRGGGAALKTSNTPRVQRSPGVLNNEILRGQSRPRQSRLSGSSVEAEGESGLGSDTSGRATSTSPYASVREMTRNNTEGETHPMSSPEGKANPSSPGKSQTLPENSRDMLANQLDHSPVFRSRRQRDRSASPVACSSLESVASNANSTLYGSTAISMVPDDVTRQDEDEDDLTLVTQSMMTLLTGFGSKTAQHDQAVHTTSGDSVEEANTATYDVPRQAVDSSTGPGSDVKSMKERTLKNSDPPTPSVRVARPSRPPPPTLRVHVQKLKSAEQPKPPSLTSSSTNDTPSSAGSSSPLVPVAAKPNSGKNAPTVGSQNRFNAANRSRSPSPTAASITCGITPEMAVHWRSRCEQLRTELATSRLQIGEAHTEIDRLSEELQRKDEEIRRLSILKPPSPPATSASPVTFPPPIPPPPPERALVKKTTPAASRSSPLQDDDIPSGPKTAPKPIASKGGQRQAAQLMQDELAAALARRKVKVERNSPPPPETRQRSRSTL